MATKQNQTTRFSGRRKKMTSNELDTAKPRNKLPHNGTPTTPVSKSFNMSRTPGTPDRPIFINDDGTAGTPNEPIWVSDSEVTDNESEADVSNIAIRGVRKSRPDQPASVPKASTKKKQARSKSKETREHRKLKESPLSTPQMEGRSSLISANSPSSQRKPNSPLAGSRESPNSRKTTQKNLKSSTPRSSSNSPSTNIASLSQQEDPMLEQELEEIALNWRVGAISGTPSAYDLEKGKEKETNVPSFVPPVAPLAEDEADRSWHNGISDVTKPKMKNRQRWYLLLSITGLLVITSCLIFVLKSEKKDKGVYEMEPNLTSRQQSMHDLLVRVTDSSILRNSNTPQHQARRWLLFRDSDFSSSDEGRIIQRYVLACFYFATGGGKQKWDEHNWLSASECGETPWKGLSCSNEGEVRAIVLDDEGLSGTLPIELGHLIGLEHLILKNNPGLYGWIPQTLAHLKSLSQLGLYKNALSGTIPDIFQHANQIRYINFEDNHMHGSIPLSIKGLINLDTLALANNKFDGMVPVAELSQTTLKYLSLSGNQFSSMLDHSIGDLTTIEYMYLDHNKLKGPVPEEILYLTNLKSLDLGSNQFTGTVPTEFGNLQRLEFLSMDRNRLEGVLPREIGLLTNLKSLNMASNQLSGALPNISNMHRLVNLQLFENQLTGSLPEAVQQLQSIEILSLSSNRLVGTIPRAINRLSSTLRGLYLSDNEIKGRIPTELCQFASLEALFLDNNGLFGPIPPCLGDLGQLQQLYLFQNQLTGQVPSTFGALSQLRGLGLEENGLTGEMPGGVCAIAESTPMDLWADCTDRFGSDPLLCSCCTVCCPSDECK